MVFDFEVQEKYVEELITDGDLEDTALTKNIYDLNYELFDPILNVGGFFVMFAFTLGLMCLSVILKVLWKAFSSLKASLSHEGGNPTIRNDEVKHEETPTAPKQRQLVDEERSLTEDILGATSGKLLNK